MHYVQRLVIIIKVTTKIYFCTPPKLLVPFSTTSTQHTDFIFCPNLAPTLKSLNTKIENFPYTPSPSEAPYKVLSSCSIHTYWQMYRHKWMHFCASLLILNTPYPKNSAMMTRNDFKWRLNIWYLHVWGAFPLPDSISLSIWYILLRKDQHI